MFKHSFLLISLLSAVCHADINLTSLSEGAVLDWEEEVFSGETLYELSSFDGTEALKASSDNAASGLFLKKRIDLQETPYINWSWLITQNLPTTDELAKSGDDYAARIYLVIEGGLFFWKTKSINYVWSSSQDAGESWNNPYASSNVRMISIRGQNDNLNQWYQEKRNVYQDLIQYLGDKGSDKANLDAYRYIDVVAIMTDTDNSGATAESYYGEIIFSLE